MQAACEGQGIALGWALLCDDLLRKGKLVRPLAAAVRTPRAFYLVTSERSDGDEVRVFREWVLAQFPPARAGAPDAQPRRAAPLALVSER
jgi:DNA-binding transcriptional LysR family regulator